MGSSNRDYTVFTVNWWQNGAKLTPGKFGLSTIMFLYAILRGTMTTILICKLYKLLITYCVIPSCSIFRRYLFQTFICIRQ